MDPLSTVAVEELVRTGLVAVARALKISATSSRPVDYSRCREALLDHLQYVANWSRTFNFDGMLAPKELSGHFINLSGFVTDENDERVRRPAQVTALLDYHGSFVLLGQPGAGKTTSLKKLASLVLLRREAGQPLVPIVVELRQASKHASLIDHLLNALAIEIAPSTDFLHRSDTSRRRRALSCFLDSIGAVLFLDGLDEVPVAQREDIEGDIAALMGHGTALRVFLSCRIADYFAPLQGLKRYIVAPLSLPQIETFVAQWLGGAAPAFMRQLEDSPFRGVEALPLTLAHLCAVFDAYGAVPEKPRSVYRLIVRLLLEDWDRQRRTQRRSAYARFESDRKEVFLNCLAFELTELGRRGDFSHDDLERAYRKICTRFGLPERDAKQVTREIESHTGLVIERSYEQYTFSHRSLQEFLCAQYLAALNPFPVHLAASMPNETAIAATLTSDPGAFIGHCLSRLVTAAIETSLGLRTLQTFLFRLAAERPDGEPSSQLGHVLLCASFVLSNTTPLAGATPGTVDWQYARTEVRGGIADAHMPTRHGMLWESARLAYRDSAKSKATPCINGIVRSDKKMVQAAWSGGQPLAVVWLTEELASALSR